MQPRQLLQKLWLIRVNDIIVMQIQVFVKNPGQRRGQPPTLGEERGAIVPVPCPTMQTRCGRVQCAISLSSSEHRGGLAVAMFKFGLRKPGVVGFDLISELFAQR
jgi:hypothetical protein